WRRRWAAVGDRRLPTPAGRGAVRPGKYGPDGVRSIGEVRSVVGKCRSVGRGTSKVERWHLFGPNGWVRRPRAVQVEVDLVECPRLPHEDVDPSLYRRAVESHLTRSIRVQAHDQP